MSVFIEVAQIKEIKPESSIMKFVVKPNYVFLSGFAKGLLKSMDK